MHPDHLETSAKASACVVTTQSVITSLANVSVNQDLEVENVIMVSGIKSNHMTGHRMTGHHATGHHVTGHHVTAHHVTGHHVTGHNVTGHHMAHSFILILV